MGEKPFERKSKEEQQKEIDRLLYAAATVMYEDRAGDVRLSTTSHYGKDKRERVLHSLSGGEDDHQSLMWKIANCRKYNLRRFKNPNRIYSGPWWNRTHNDWTLSKEDRAIKEDLEFARDTGSITKLQYKNRVQKLGWFEKTYSREEKQELSSFHYGDKDSFKGSAFTIDEILSGEFKKLINPKRLEQYLKKATNKEACQSLWCPHCRKAASSSHLLRVQNHLRRRTYIINDDDDNEFNLFEDDKDWFHQFKQKYNNSHLKHITGVVGLCEFDPNSLDDLLKNKDRLVWRRINTRIGDGKIPSIYDPWIEVVYEFELVNKRHLLAAKGSDPYKVKHIKQLLSHSDVKGEKFLLVHFHGLTNLNRDQIREVFKKEYWLGKSKSERLVKTDEECGLYIQSLRSDKSLNDNLEKITSYPFKDAYRYKHSYIGSDYKNGEFFDLEELRTLISCYSKVQGKNWKGLFRSCSSNNIELREKYGRMYYKPEGSTPHQVWSIVGSKVWIVDCLGNIFMNGWDPDCYVHIRNVKVKVVTVHRSASKRQWFFDPRMKPHQLLIYKNVYDEGSFKTTTDYQEMTLSEYYSSNKILENKKPMSAEQERLRSITMPHMESWWAYARQYRAQKQGKTFIDDSETVIGVDVPIAGMLGRVRWLNGQLKMISDKEVSSKLKKRFLTKFKDVQDGLKAWKEREKVDVYPHGYQRVKFMNDWGVEDDDIDLIEELVDEPLLLPPPSNN